MYLFLDFLLFSVGINFLLFLIAYLFQTDKITDISYSLTFIVIASYAFLQSDRSGVDLVLFALVLIWGLRLGSYLFIRIKRIGRDKRFDQIRINFISFFFFWLMQGLTCAIVMLPIILSSQQAGKSFSFSFLIGLIIALAGLLIESIADHQKYYFKNKNPDQFMQTGLWSIVQHPNYTGELFFWLGIFIASLPFVQWYFAIIGPIWISLILLGFSGVPILQRDWNKKYGKDRNFVNYRKATKKILPYIY